MNYYMGDFGAVSQEQKVRRERLKEREPAMVKPTLKNQQNKVNTIYYFDDGKSGKRKPIKVPVQTVFSEKIQKGLLSPVISKSELKKQKIKKKVKLTSPIRSNNELKIVKPVSVQVKAPTREVTYKKPVKEIIASRPTRQLSLKAPTKEVTMIKNKNQIANQAKKMIKNSSKLPKKKVINKYKKFSKKELQKQAKKIRGMSGNYSMGDFGENEMGFKIKMPKLKMPRITIGKKMQAEILKPISKVASIAAPAVAFIPGVGTVAAAGIAAAGATTGQFAAKAEYDLAVKKAKDQQKKIEAQMAAEMTAEQQAQIQAQTNQQIAQAEQQKKKGMATAGILGIGAVAALGAFFLMKD